MDLIRKELKEHMTPVHKMLLAIAAMCIISSPAAMLYPVIADGPKPSPTVRFILVLTIIAGPFIGIALLAAVSWSLERRYQAHMNTVRVRILAQGPTPAERAALFEGFALRTYNYEHAQRQLRKIAFLAPTAFIILLAAQALLLDPRPVRLLLVGILAVIAFPTALVMYLIVKGRSGDDFVMLCADGIKYRQGGTEGIFPWDSVTEIRETGKAHRITSTAGELFLWNDIAPSPLPSRGFRDMVRLREQHVITLLRQIKQMNPAIIYLEPDKIGRGDYVFAGISILVIIGLIAVIIIALM